MFREMHLCHRHQIAALGRRGPACEELEVLWRDSSLAVSNSVVLTFVSGAGWNHLDVVYGELEDDTRVVALKLAIFVEWP